MQPDGSELRPVALPKTCSPQKFTRAGDVLSCAEWSNPWLPYNAATYHGRWRRVARPEEWRFPHWVTAGMSDASDFALDAPEWAPDRERIALIRRPHAPYGDIWFSATGDLVVADRDGSDKQVVAKRAEVPTWSPDGSRLAFLRCRVTEAPPTAAAADSATCSLWTVSADPTRPPEKLADDVDSPPVWSPDGRFIAFFRRTRKCTLVCKALIIVVPAKGGRGRAVRFELSEPSQLFWLPEQASALVVANAPRLDDPRQLQRCADIWNRAHMQWPTGVANVRLVKHGCQVTVGENRIDGYLASGFPCSQPVLFSYQCPSHGDVLRNMNPAQRIWNAQVDEHGRLTLVEAPSGPRLRLPKAPPYPLLNGYVLPFTSDGQPRPGLTFTTTVTGACFTGGDIKHPDSMRCGWPGRKFFYTDNSCFKAPGRVRVGDVVLCPEGAGSTRFVPVKLAKLNEPWD